VKGRNTGIRRENRGRQGRERTRERRGREWRGPAVYIFKFSLE